MLTRHIDFANGNAVPIISIIAHTITADAGRGLGIPSAIIKIPVWLIARSNRDGAATVKNSALTVNFGRVINWRQLC